MKTCRTCETKKDFSEFHKGITNKDGYRPHCKECRNKYNQEWYSENIDTVKSKYSYEKNKHYKLKKTFGIGYQEYLHMLAAQDNCCGICGTDESGARAFAVDHCHTTGNIRGLLCGNCNSGIGHLKDDVELLKRAIQYLENSKGI